MDRPCQANHCDDEHRCVRRKDITFQYYCIPKYYLERQKDFTEMDETIEFSNDLHLIDFIEELK